MKIQFASTQSPINVNPASQPPTHLKTNISNPPPNTHPANHPPKHKSTYTHFYFIFIEALCQTINYADDNSLAEIDSDSNAIKAELQVATVVAIQWFKENFMQAKNSKFQALYVSKAVNPTVPELFIGDIIVRSEPRAKPFGIHIDQRI